jgi:Flp pilus assembly protein TadD
MLLLQQEKTDDALNHFQEAVKIQSQYAKAHYQLSLILKQKGRTEEANRHYQEAIRLTLDRKDHKK